MPLVHQSFTPLSTKALPSGGRARRTHSTRAGSEPDGGLREREARDGAARASREVAALLLLGAEEHDGLGDADRLVRRQQRRHVRVVAPNELHGRSYSR